MIDNFPVQSPFLPLYALSRHVGPLLRYRHHGMKILNRLFVLIIVTVFNLAGGQSLTGDRGRLISSELLEHKTAYQVDRELSGTILFFKATYGTSIYKLVYETIDPDGEPTIASGTVTVPKNPDFALPILSFQSGTMVKRDEASSATGFDGGYGIVAMWTGSSGYLTVIPDYLGLGESELFHPYQMAEPNATAVIDMLRAARTFCEEKKIETNEQLFLTGYSEGGYTMMATHKMIEEKHSDEFNVTASAPGAGAYDMSGTMVELMLSGEEYPSPYYLPYVLFAFDEYYNIWESPTDFLKEDYATSLPALFDGTHSSSEINAAMPSVPMEIMRPDVVEEFSSNENHPLREALRDNDLYDWTPQAPMRLYHSSGDDIVPVKNTRLAYEAFQENGATQVELFECDCGTHGEAAAILLFLGFAWIESLADKNQPLSLKHNIAPEEYNLLSVYPSPFNSSTKIIFSLKEGSEVTLTVHDLLGKEVEMLAQGTLPAGHFEFPWNASRFAGGLYIITLKRTNSQGMKERRSRKVLYLK